MSTYQLIILQIVLLLYILFSQNFQKRWFKINLKFFTINCILDPLPLINLASILIWDFTMIHRNFKKGKLKYGNCEDSNSEQKNPTMSMDIWLYIYGCQAM